MELSDLLAAIRRRRLTGAITFLLVVAAAAAVVVLPGKTFSATETLLIEPQAGGASNGGVQVVQFLIAAVPSQIGSQRFHDEVAGTLPPSQRKAAIKLSATSDQTTGLVTLSAKSSQRTAVEPWAVAAGRLLPTTGTAAAPGVATIIPLNTAHSVSSSIPTKAVLAGSVILGLLLAVLSALVADSVRSRPSRRERLQQRCGVPVFAELPMLRAAQRLPRTIFSHRASHRAAAFVESVEAVRLGLTTRMGQHGMSSIAIVSRRSGEGKSLLTACLGWAIARAGGSVVLVDADLRSPVLPELLEVPDGHGHGLAAYHRADRPTRTALAGLELMPAGFADRHPAEIITLHLDELLRNLAGDDRVALVDTPAFDEAAEVAAITAAADGVVILVDERQTRLNEITPLIDDLRSFGAQVVGIVLSRSRQRGRLLPRAPGRALAGPANGPPPPTRVPRRPVVAGGIAAGDGRGSDAGGGGRRTKRVSPQQGREPVTPSSRGGRS